MLDWTKWASLRNSSTHRSAAVYQIRLCSQSEPIRIARFLGDDYEGVLSIGMTTNVERRRAAFVRAVGQGRGHSEGNLLHILERDSPHRDRLRGAKYEYRYAPVQDAAAAQLMEERLIKDYFLRFGEVPPLNSAIPERYGEYPRIEEPLG